MHVRQLHAVFCAVVALVALGLLLQLGRLSSDSTLRTPPVMLLDRIAAGDAVVDVSLYCARVAPPISSVTISLIVASCNRSASLLRVLPSWLTLRGMDEAVVLDWGSSPPLSVELPAELDARVRLIRAPYETEWNLARAYNLAVRLARGVQILKVKRIIPMPDAPHPPQLIRSSSAAHPQLIRSSSAARPELVRSSSGYSSSPQLLASPRPSKLTRRLNLETSHAMPYHPTVSTAYPITSTPASSHNPVPSHPIPSHPIPSQPILSYPAGRFGHVPRPPFPPVPSTAPRPILRRRLAAGARRERLAPKRHHDAVQGVNGPSCE